MDQNNMKKIAPIIIAIIAVGGIAFYGGMRYAGGSNSSGQNFPQGQGQQTGFGANGARGARTGGGPNGARAGMNLVNGEIISKDDKSVTIKLRDGGSQIVFLSGTTEITKSVSGTVSDLTIGQNIFAGGSKNSDGSVTATTVQLRPAFSPSPSGSPAASAN